MEYPPNLASPLDILVEASNGASDYGNKFGEPVICGFNRAPSASRCRGERREWVKPIMFSAGLGQMSAAHADKGAPEPGMWVVKLGGPAYRIGVGGGAASSRVGDAASAALDFDAVQRGDAEMENKMNRVIRACVELGEANPIVSIHDQGAGGNGNVLKEICRAARREAAGARHPVGRPDALGPRALGRRVPGELRAPPPRRVRGLFKAICARENCPCAFLGKVSGDGRLLSRTRRRLDAPSTSRSSSSSPTCRRRRSPRRRRPLRRRQAARAAGGRHPRVGPRPRAAAAVGGLEALPHEQGRPLGHRADRAAAVRRPAATRRSPTSA